MNNTTLLYKYRDLEYWIRFDDEFEVYEMFTEVEAESYLGTFDTKDEAFQFARVAANEWYFNS